eukprot:45052-Prymnesium_polylepis.1
MKTKKNEKLAEKSYRLSDDDAVRKSKHFVSGRVALERARFNLREERVAVAMCVVDPQGTKHYIYVFFSVNVRMPSRDLSGGEIEAWGRASRDPRGPCRLARPVSGARGMHGQ